MVQPMNDNRPLSGVTVLVVEDDLLLAITWRRRSSALARS
jgi:hypothetical protein